MNTAVAAQEELTKRPRRRPIDRCSKLSDRIRREETKKIRRILFIVCTFMGVWPQELKDTRKGHVIPAKQMYYYLCRKLTMASERMIGELIDRTHGAVSVGSYAFEDIISLPHERELKIQMEIVERKFKQSYEIII